MTDAELIELNRKSIVDDDAYRMADIAAKCHGPQPILLDIGANVGWWTRHWLTHCPHGRAFCYEPIIENIQRIPHDPRIVVFDLAVAPEAGILKMYRHTGTQWKGKENSQLWSVLKDFKGDVTADRLVSAVSFETVLRSYPHINVLKMDIEGCEVQLLHYIKPTDLRKIDVFVLEEHRSTDRSKFRDAGFREWFHAFNSLNHPVYIHERMQHVDS